MTLRPHFQDTGKNSFFGGFVYQRIVPKDHFLVGLDLEAGGPPLPSGSADRELAPCRRVSAPHCAGWPWGGRVSNRE